MRIVVIILLIVIPVIIGLLNAYVTYKTRLPYAGDLHLTEAEDGTLELYYISVLSFETLKNNEDIRVKVIKH